MINLDNIIVQPRTAQNNRDRSVEPKSSARAFGNDMFENLKTHDDGDEVNEYGSAYST